MVEQNVEIKKEVEDKELDNFQIDTFKLESDIPYDENNEPIEDIKVSPELFDNDEDYIPEDQGSNLLRGIDSYSLPVFLDVHWHPKQKEFFKCYDAFLK